jgi:hypothetical protein
VRVPDIVQEHRRRNETTRDRWETMASHRARVMRLLSEARGEAGRSLCVLGAGNGNDIDLAQLVRKFERVALVDLDEQALGRAVERLTEDERRRAQLHAAVDLAGVLPILETWQGGHLPDDAELKSVIDAARASRAPAIGTFDVVASTCVLSQLIDSIYIAMVADQPWRTELVLAVRNRHLEIMIELLNPGGAGVLVTDFVATETAPELAYLDDTQIPAAAVNWINQRNFFTGTNPYAIRDYLHGLKNTVHAVEDVQVSPAWRWDIGAKQLAVSAITFRRRIEICGPY